MPTLFFVRKGLDDNKLDSLKVELPPGNSQTPPQESTPPHHQKQVPLGESRRSRAKVGTRVAADEN